MIARVYAIMFVVVILIAIVLCIAVALTSAQTYNPALEQQASYFMWQTLENDKQRAWESEPRTHLYDNQLRRNPYEMCQTCDGPMYPGILPSDRQYIHGRNDD